MYPDFLVWMQTKRNIARLLVIETKGDHAPQEGRSWLWLGLGVLASQPRPDDDEEAGPEIVTGHYTVMTNRPPASF